MIKILIKEAKWSQGVKTKWQPKSGLFKIGSANEIAKAALSGHKGDAGDAIKALTFFLNRGGKNIPSDMKNKVEKAIEILQKKEKK